MKRVFLIRRKGFNYYTDYTELYLHKSFESIGYYLVKDESKCLFNVIVDISENEKYMTMVSPYIDALSYDDANKFAECLSINFKSEVVVMPSGSDYRFKGTPYRFMFSDVYNAFEEDAYVYQKKPEFAREMFSNCKNQQPYVAEFINYGGAFKGLTIIISFGGADVELEETTINYYKGRNKKEKVSQKIFFEKTDNVFISEIDDFEMDKGINKYSAVLRGKKRDDEKSKHGFYIRFIPKSCDSEHLEPIIYIRTSHE